MTDKENKEYKDAMKVQLASDPDVLMAIAHLQSAREHKEMADKSKERAKELLEPIMREYGLTSLPDDSNGFDINYTGPSKTISYDKERIKSALLERGVDPGHIAYAMDQAKKTSDRKASISYRKRPDKKKGK